MSSDDYNYAIFPPEDDVDAFAHFMEFLKVGQIAPDPELYPLDTSEPVRLRSVTQTGMTIIEFGSLT
ncbi:MAG TPA: hypothetical protein VHA53_04295 [Nitrolancea sp.]|jgi:hypothetical protein|nr:hypothetical protein [Nitrolancea sp.]